MEIEKGIDELVKQNSQLIDMYKNQFNLVLQINDSLQGQYKAMQNYWQDIQNVNKYAEQRVAAYEALEKEYKKLEQEYKKLEKEYVEKRRAYDELEQEYKKNIGQDRENIYVCNTETNELTEGHKLLLEQYEDLKAEYDSIVNSTWYQLFENSINRKNKNMDKKKNAK